MRAVALLLALAAPAAHGQHEGHRMPPAEKPTGEAMKPRSDRPLPPGHAEVQVTAERQQLIGVKTAPVARGTAGGEVRATALVQVDETRQVHIHSRLMGWVERIYVNAVGQRVRRGEPLYSLYSQELYATQVEYLRARKTAPELAVAARRRFELWNVPDDQVRLIEQKGPQRAIVFRSPIDGTVLEKNVLLGHAVDPQMPLYVIADLSRLWVIADVYEYEAPAIRPGAHAVVEVQGLFEPVHGTVDYVYPTVDPVSRTVKVRIVVDNSDGRLKPGMYATAVLSTPPREALWVSREALIDTGQRQIVYLALEGGRFRPVEVRAGRIVDDKVEILSGLREGEQVLVSAQFLIDSESRIRGAAGSMPAHGGH